MIKCEQQECPCLDKLTESFRETIQCLKLSDLLDVSGCLSPKAGEVLTFTGGVWNAAPLPKLNNINLEIIPEFTEGTLLATIIKNGEKNFIYTPKTTNVQVNPTQSSGNKIATITVDNITKDLYTGNITPGGVLDNIKVNQILGTVTNKIAQVTVTGNDVNITGYEESEGVNEELELDSRDTVNQSFGKLAKALKDDEAAVTRALKSIKEAAGLDQNLHYTAMPKDNQRPHWDPISDEAAVYPNISTVLEQIVSVINNLEDSLKKTSLTFEGGFSTVTGSLPYTPTTNNNSGNHIKVSIPPAIIVNITKQFPLQNEFYSIQSIVNNQALADVCGKLLSMGSIITFEYAASQWRGYQYVGPVQDSSKQVEWSGWNVITNWKIIWDTN